MRWSIVPGCFALSFLGAACRDPGSVGGRYFDQTPPGDTPAVFAPGTISLENRFEQFLLYSPDGRELTFGVTNGDWSAFALQVMTMEGGRWSAAVPAPYLGSDSSALTAAVALETGAVFFTSARPSYPPADIWMTTPDEAGWSEPVRLGAPISSEADEFEVAVSGSGTLYFSSSRAGGEGDLDIYRAPLVNGEYPVAENLGPPINTKAGDDLPYIAPDESYLIFASDRSGGLGNRDLYISFQLGGAWTAPANLGRPINSEAWDIYPSISPDGRYLFFTRRDGWETTEDSDIYWVSARFIDRRREAALAGR